jgi:type I restriction enzyme, R subunit
VYIPDAALANLNCAGQKISPLFSKIIQGRFSKLKEEEQISFRDALKRYVTQYSFVSQIITWIDPELEKFYLFTKLLLKYLPPKNDTMPEEILSMVDMDKFRLQEQQNGSIVLTPGNTELKNISGGKTITSLIDSAAVAN